jgi:N-acetylglucosaminyldiphosphoundecaprenol N-acetyl-beta-D-mannosaminyltransferase
MRIDIAGVQVDAITKDETLERIGEYVRSGQPHHLVTTYSEFIVEAQANPAYREVLNGAALSLPDGVGILWAAKFLSMPRREPIIVFLNWLGSLASIVLSPQSVRTVIKEQVSGSRLIWDIAELAQKNNYSLALVGGNDSVAAQAAYELKGRFPGLRVNLAISGGYPFDEKTVSEIAHSQSDILLVAYQPPKQEMWLAENLKELNVKVAMGLGGTFDYLSGKKSPAPEWMHKIGLEWLWRLITQPHRIKRMWRAIPVFSLIILKYKLNS